MNRLKDYKTNLVVGKIESGKTVGIVFDAVDEIIKKEESFLVVDYKEEYLGNYYNDLKENGYDISILNLKDFDKSNSFNFLDDAYKNYKVKDFEKCVNILDSFFSNVFKSGAMDPFWDLCAKDLCVGISLVLLELSDVGLNLASVYGSIEYVSKYNKDRDLLKDYVDSLDESNLIRVYLNNILSTNLDTKLSVFSVASQRLKSFCIYPSLVNLLCNNEFNDLGEKSAIFVIPHLKNEINAIATSLISNVYNKISGNSFNFIFDNIDQFSMIKILPELISFPKNNIKTIMCCRDINKLKRIYGDIFDDVFNVINIEELVLDVRNIKNESVEFPKTKEEKVVLNLELLLKDKFEDGE